MAVETISIRLFRDSARRGRRRRGEPAANFAKLPELLTSNRSLFGASTEAAGRGVAASNHFPIGQKRSKSL
jgi:hypothetical protein